MSEIRRLKEVTKGTADLYSRTEKELVDLREISQKRKKEVDEAFRAYQTTLVEKPNEAERLYAVWENKKSQHEKMQMKIAALEGALEKLKGSVSESKDLVKKEREKNAVTEGEEVLKAFHDLTPLLIRLAQRAAVVIDLIENSRRSRPVKHYRGMVRCKIKDKGLKGIIAYSPPVEMRKGDPTMAFDVMQETRAEDKPLFVEMGVSGALELQAEGKVEVVDDLNQVEVEIENRLSPLPPIFDVLSSLKLHLIPGNGLSSGLEEYASKGLPVSVYDISRLMTEEEKQSILKKILDEG